MATVMHTDGRVREIVPLDGRRVFTLRELQAIVGGYIEAVYGSADGRVLYCNEDGKRLGLPVNAVATARLRHLLRPGDVLVGDVVLCTRAETGDEGNEGDDPDLW